MSADQENGFWIDNDTYEKMAEKCKQHLRLVEINEDRYSELIKAKELLTEAMWAVEREKPTLAQKIHTFLTS